MPFSSTRELLQPLELLDLSQCFLDGPYGTPSRRIFTSEHAVLIGAGIGITPFASILQSIMFRWVPLEPGNIPGIWDTRPGGAAIQSSILGICSHGHRWGLSQCQGFPWEFGLGERRWRELGHGQAAGGKGKERLGKSRKRKEGAGEGKKGKEKEGRGRKEQEKVERSRKRQEWDNGVGESDHGIGEWEGVGRNGRKCCSPVQVPAAEAELPQLPFLLERGTAG